MLWRKKMKKIFAAAFLLTMAATSAAAAWTDDFAKDFDKLGLDLAVENALINEISPHEILTFIVSNSEKFDTRFSLKALYCAGVERTEVREAADKLGITIKEVSTALEESIAECGSRLALNDRDVFFPNDSSAAAPKQYASPSAPSHIQ